MNVLGGAGGPNSQIVQKKHEKLSENPIANQITRYNGGVFALRVPRATFIMTFPASVPKFTMTQ